MFGAGEWYEPGVNQKSSDLTGTALWSRALVNPPTHHPVFVGFPSPNKEPSLPYVKESISNVQTLTCPVWLFKTSIELCIEFSYFWGKSPTASVSEFSPGFRQGRLNFEAAAWVRECPASRQLWSKPVMRCAPAQRSSRTSSRSQPHQGHAQVLEAAGWGRQHFWRPSWPCWIVKCGSISCPSPSWRLLGSVRITAWQQGTELSLSPTISSCWRLQGTRLWNSLSSQESTNFKSTLSLLPPLKNCFFAAPIVRICKVASWFYPKNIWFWTKNMWTKRWGVDMFDQSSIWDATTNMNQGPKPPQTLGSHYPLVNIQKAIGNCHL